MKTYTTNGHKAVKETESIGIGEAAEIFAMRKARAQYGTRGTVRTCNLGSYAEDGSLAEFSAFIGTNKGNETTGHNVNFTVYAL